MLPDFHQLTPMLATYWNLSVSFNMFAIHFTTTTVQEDFGKQAHATQDSPITVREYV